MSNPTTNIGLSDLKTTYGAPPGPVKLSDFYKGGSLVPEKAPNNPAQDLSPAVPTFGTIKIGQFRGSNAGFGAIQSSGENIDISTLFGDDWDENVAKTVVIPSGTAVGQLIVDGGSGNRTVQIDGEIQGLWGASAGDGGHALHLVGSPGPGDLVIVNNGAIRGGGGGGGTGGVGGGGGPGSYLGLETEGPFYVNTGASGGADPGDFFANYSTQGGSPKFSQFVWDGVMVGNFPFSNVTQFTHEDGWTYVRGEMYSSPNPQQFWIFRQRDGVVLTVGGVGGAGGVGGRGRGFNQPLTAGSAGSDGAAGGTNAGAGGAGGVGGSGADWGLMGDLGNVGATGAPGNEGAGSPGGAPPTNRGSPGNSVYATVAWSIQGSGTLNGPTGPISAS